MENVKKLLSLTGKWNMVKYALFLPLTIPHYLYSLCVKERSKIKEDVHIWMHGQSISFFIDLTYLLIFYKEYRNVFYLRVGPIIRRLLFYLPQERSLYIGPPSKNVGGGFFIHHGFSTIIVAKSIGKNVWINQQVTIGYSRSHNNGYGCPAIGDNVQISAGAVVVGNIVIGDNAKIEANTTVTKDVPPNSVIVSSPSYILTHDSNGDSIKKKL